MTLPALMLAAALAVPVPAPPVTVIVGATLLDGGGRAPLADSIVVLRGEQVAAVGDRMRTPIPKGAALVDGRRMWIVPVPAAAASGPALLAAIPALLRGPIAHVREGRPANLALLDADPRAAGTPPSSVRRVWNAGKPVPGPAR